MKKTKKQNKWNEKEEQKHRIDKTKEVTYYDEQITNMDNNRMMILRALLINIPITEVLLEIVVAYCSDHQCQGILICRLGNQIGSE